MLNIELIELPRWNCCGTVYSLASDNLYYQVGALRNLIRVETTGETRVITLCAMCYNTLKQTNNLVKSDPSVLRTLNTFMDRETDYEAKVEVIHFLELLKNHVGFDEVAKRVKKPLNGLKLAPYYGCLLLRPKSISIDDVEEPRIIQHLLEGVGAVSIPYPYKTECCGSYLTVNNKAAVTARAYCILSSAIERGADAIVVSCPLCAFNLDARQKDVQKLYNDFVSIPILYFTQLLSIAFGLDLRVCEFKLHTVDPIPMLKRKGLV
jgi:heterodisulfide reductase subunit B